MSGLRHAARRLSASARAHHRPKGPWTTILGVRYALHGLWVVIWSEGSFRMELFALAFACIIGPLRGFSAEHWTLITIGSVMVLMAELFNSAIERLLQLCHPREDGAEYSYPDDVARSEVVRATYDISAAAVCVALTFTGLVLLHAIIWPTGSVF